MIQRKTTTTGASGDDVKLKWGENLYSKIVKIPISETMETR